MSAGAIFNFLGLVAFCFVFLLVIADGGVFLVGASPAMLLVFAFGWAILLHVLATRWISA